MERYGYLYILKDITISSVSIFICLYSMSVYLKTSLSISLPYPYQFILRMPPCLGYCKCLLWTMGWNYLFDIVFSGFDSFRYILRSAIVGSYSTSQRKQWHPTPVLLPGKSHEWRSLVGYSPWGREESDTTEWLHFHFSLSCIGEGNGNPLQCSCLENPRYGGAWWAAIYGVAQSQTQMKQLSSSSIVN